MKILMVNNRLKVHGGEGTYMTSVGDELIKQGHDVQYFGLKDEDGIHGNRYEVYARKSMNPFKLIKNDFNRKQFARILDAFQPEIIHLNLIYFTLTPSILVEAKKRGIPVIQTIHDGKIVCPSYQLYVSGQNRKCTDCLDGNFRHCIQNKCHKNSIIFSSIACKEAEYNRNKGYYNLIDRFVFPSSFMRDLHVKSGIPEEKATVLCNFSRIKKRISISKNTDRYVLFFGRVIKVKGIEILAKVIDMLSDVNFVIAGIGDMEALLQSKKNCSLVGFKQGKELEELIAGAVCSVFPSVWYENCPMSIMESIALGTPVIGSDIGGIPELIDEGKTGFVVRCGDAEDIARSIMKIWADEELSIKMSLACINNGTLMGVNEYVKKITKLYQEMMDSK